MKKLLPIIIFVGSFLMPAFVMANNSQQDQCNQVLVGLDKTIKELKVKSISKNYTAPTYIAPDVCLRKKSYFDTNPIDIILENNNLTPSELNKIIKILS